MEINELSFSRYSPDEAVEIDEAIDHAIMEKNVGVSFDLGKGFVLRTKDGRYGVIGKAAVRIIEAGEVSDGRVMEVVTADDGCLVGRIFRDDSTSGSLLYKVSQEGYRHAFAFVDGHTVLVEMLEEDV